MNEFLEQFLIESRELMAQANQDLLAIELKPDDRDRIDSAFRAFHTLKGGAGIVDFDAMGKALHAAEDVLSAVRKRERQVTPTLVSSCLFCLDQVERWLNAIEATGDMPPAAEALAEADKIIARFGHDESAAKSDAALPLQPRAGSQSTLSTAAIEILQEQLRLLSAPDTSRRKGLWLSAVKAAANVLRASDRREAAGKIEALATGALEDGDTASLVAAVTAALATLETGKSETPPTQDLAPRTFRVDGARVDALVNLTGELTVAKNAIGHVVKLAVESSNPLAATLRDQHGQIERLVAGLQHMVLGMRVLPLRHVFQRFQRLVREMAVALDKPTRLITEGDDTEADKAVVEALYEPLLHIIRNAMDHGIEPAQQRLKLNKPPVATILLRANRQTDNVLIEVSDDGGGIDVQRVRAVALDRGIASAESLAALTDAEAIDMIFEPGFSTATEVTAHSGRGVGMDAVRTGLERFGGRVTVESRARKSCRSLRHP